MTIRHIITAAAFALGLAAPAQSETLKLGLITPPSHQWTKSAYAFADAVAEQSGGRLNVEVFPAGQLGNEAQILKQLQTGALDLAFMTVGELTNRDATFGALTAPYLVKTGKEAARLLEGPTATAILDRLDTLGLKGLGYGMAGMRIVLLSKDTPLEEGGTVAKRKIRTVPLAQEMDFWRMAGATPTPLPLTELYDAYANGQIDGMQIDFEGTYNTRFYEMSSAVLDTEHMIFPMVAAASARKWKGWSEANQNLIAQLIAEQTKKLRELYPQIDADYRSKLQETGVPILTPGPDVFGPAIADWNHVWESKTPILKDLRREAAMIAQSEN
jgi:TRAP-type C4-dicarboxylate transport system substrate-binding protein